MMRKLFIIGVLLVTSGLVAFWFLTAPAVVPAAALAPYSPNLDNGKTMFFAGGCASCHATPNQEDRTRLGGGFALNSPVGPFHVPNISPHRRDGIGAWSEAQFVTAVIKGTSPNGRHYYPAFPYPSYQRMRVEDVRDLFAFLKTLPEVEGKVGDHELRFPYNVRLGMGVWKFLYLDGRMFTSDAAQSAEWNRGAYLVEGPGHCAECHSPRNFLGGIVAGQRFAGGPNPEGEGWIPNITQQRLKDWEADDIAYLLETGQGPNGDSVGGRMVAVVRNTSQLSEQDRNAMALYVKSLPPVVGPQRPPRN
jgi:mono/diheme cytochrome c family protein